MLTIGDKFPKFSAQAVVSLEKGKEFKTITSEDYAGKWKIVFFWPKDFTFVCPTEIAGFGKKNRDFLDRDAQVLGVSTDNEYVHLAWRKSHPDLKDLPFPMISDITRELSQSLGIMHQHGGCGDARDVHRRSGRHHPLRERHRPGRGPQHRRGRSRPRRSADRRALPLQLAEGSADARGGIT